MARATADSSAALRNDKQEGIDEDSGCARMTLGGVWESGVGWDFGAGWDVAAREYVTFWLPIVMA